MGKDLFKNLKQQSLAFMTPSRSNTSLFLALGLHFYGFLTPMCMSQIYTHVYL